MLLNSLERVDILEWVSLSPLDGFPFNASLMKATHLVAGSFLGSLPIKDFALSSRFSSAAFFSGANSFFFLTTGFFGFATAFFFLAGAFAVFLVFVAAAFALGLALVFVAGFADFAAVRPVVLLAVAVAKPRTATLDL